MATLLGYFIQFRPHAGKDSILHEYENIELSLGASVVSNLVSKLPVIHTSNYHIVMDNYFTNPALNVSFAGMPRARSNRVAYQDAKKRFDLYCCK